MATVDANANRIVAKLPAVKKAVRAQADSVAARAKSNLAGHRSTGAAKVTVTQGRVDSFVNLEDDAAISIEHGHVADDGTAVQGIYALHRAIGKK